MEHYFLGLFQSHFDILKQWGVYIVFAVALLESLPFIGALIPGQILIIFGGFLVKLGFFSFLWAFIATAAGAILGDLIGFFLGEKYGRQIRGKKIWLLEKEHLDKAIALLEQNSIKSIFVGRLHSFTRAFMPFAAGISKIESKKFITVDVITASIWAALSLGIGFLFGKSFQVAGAFYGKFTIITTLIAIIVIAAISEAGGKEKKNVSTNAILIGFSAISLYLFTITANGFGKSAFFRILDIRVAGLMAYIQSEWLTPIMLFFTNIGGPYVMPIFAVILILLLLNKKRWKDASFAAFALGIGMILVNILKAVFQRPRPVLPFLHVTGTSFPSGHAAMAAIFGVVLYYTSLRKIQSNRSRSLAILASCLVVFAIGLSRVYLNVHFASDVLGGYFVGIFFGILMIVLLRVGNKLDL
ncbi:MAG: bifunctional DedA family/phosphatase PAP2 family protein [Patescibacteria group bacterium]